MKWGKCGIRMKEREVDINGIIVTVYKCIKCKKELADFKDMVKLAIKSARRKSCHHSSMQMRTSDEIRAEMKRQDDECKREGHWQG